MNKKSTDLKPRYGGNFDASGVFVCGKCTFHLTSTSPIKCHSCTHPQAIAHLSKRAGRYMGEYDLVPRWCPIEAAKKSSITS